MASLSPFDSVPTGSRKFGGSTEPVVVRSRRPKPEPVPLPVTDDGWSTCPGCDRTWLVLAHDDVHLPSCGCYGDDWHDGNRHRPCSSCGMKHEAECPDGTDPASQPEDELPQWVHGPAHCRGKEKA